MHCTKSTNAKGEGKEMKGDRGRDKRQRCKGNFKRGARGRLTGARGTLRAVQGAGAAA